MNAWQRWLQAPQTHWLRRALFQVHLWTGIGLGVYVLVIGLSGSALLVKWKFYEWFEPKWVTVTADMPLEGDALKARMAEVYAGYELGFTVEAYEPENATFIVLNKDGEYFPHYFNQYTGEDLGPANPWPIKAIDWLANVHDDLLMERAGRRINGALALVLVLMSATGLVIWWQGRARWYEGLFIWPNAQHSVWWQLHSCLGFWSLLLMLAWGVSGFQLGFPGAVNSILGWFQGEGPREPSSVLQFFRNVHFGRYGEGPWARGFWMTVSFIPTVMFGTGAWLWWRRVIRKRPYTSAPTPAPQEA